MDLGERIRAAREAKALSKSELARRIGVSRTAVGDWENNVSIPRKDKILALAKELGVPPSAFELFGGDTVSRLSISSQQKMVLLLEWSDLRHVEEGKVAVHALKERKYIQGDTALADETFAVCLEDDSMEPTFRQGEVVLIDPAAYPQKHDFVLVRLASGGQHLFREYMPRPHGTFDLRAENPEYSTLTANKSTPVEVLGVMVEHRRKRRVP